MFIDKDYQGVVIKIPDYFIKINNLGPLLAKFTKELEEQSKLSTMLPDYCNSIYELQNYTDKADKRKQEKEEQERRNLANRKRLKPRIEKNIFDLEWCMYESSLGNDTLIINDEEYNIFDYLNQKSIKKEKLKELNVLIKSFSDKEFLTIIKDYCFTSFTCFLDKLKYKEHWEFDCIYIDSYCNWAVRFNKIAIRWQVDERSWYKELPIQSGNNGLYFSLPTNKGGILYLSDYNIDKEKRVLIKKGYVEN